VRHHLVFAALLITTAAHSARAQTVTTADGRDLGYFAVSGVYQPNSSSVQDTLTRPSFAETETVTSTYTGSSARGFDLTGGVTLRRNVAVGVAVTRFARSKLATVSASIPHPFFFNRPRQIAGATAVVHRETAVHIHAAWIPPLEGPWYVLVFGGPSIFNVRQGLVTDVVANDPYPYDAPTFASASAEEQSHSGVGGHVGADVSFMFLQNVGVGVGVRLSRATLTFTDAVGQSLKIDAGGAEVGVGLRLWFR